MFSRIISQDLSSKLKQLYIHRETTTPNPQKALTRRGQDPDRDLRRSNAMRRRGSANTSANSKSLRRQVASRPLSSSSKRNRNTPSAIVRIQELDKKLPDVLRTLVDRKYSCTLIGRYLVDLLLGADSFYSGFIARQVYANKTYYDICVRVFRLLDLSTEEGIPLESKTDKGDWSLKPDPSKLTTRLSFEDP
ncbi:hypothetical protein BJX76DRAFT_354323 [Aspergillus varians]